MLFCLENGIKFEMYSCNSKLMGTMGWGSYFLEFCDEVREDAHKVYNYRYPQGYLFALAHVSFLVRRWLFKRNNGIAYLTADLWDRFRSRRCAGKTYDIPALGISGTTQDACRTIVDMTYRFNDKTRVGIEQRIRGAQMPSRYAGIHIRAGDKAREYGLKPPSAYLDRLRSVSTLKDVFVLTDHYGALAELQELLPGFSFYTLCERQETGYNHTRFCTFDDGEKSRRMLNLFASMEILANAEVFVGTYSSNPGAFLGMRMAPGRVHALDRTEWLIY